MDTRLDDTPREQRLDRAVEELSAAVAAQSLDDDPAHEDFYRWGAVLDMLTYRLYGAAHVLGRQVERYGQRRILRDDTGADPAPRLAEASGHLDRLRDLLGQANEEARRYHSAVGHIAVEVDPDADEDTP